MKFPNLVDHLLSFALLQTIDIQYRLPVIQALSQLAYNVTIKDIVYSRGLLELTNKLMLHPDKQVQIVCSRLKSMYKDYKPPVKSM